MEPIRFKGMNITYTAPDCGDLPARGEIENDIYQVTSCWRPSDEELAILNAGGCVCLNILHGQPPVAMWVQHVDIVD